MSIPSALSALNVALLGLKIDLGVGVYHAKELKGVSNVRLRAQLVQCAHRAGTNQQYYT